MVKFSTGFIGATHDAMLEQAINLLPKRSRKIVLPFTGSAKDLPLLSLYADVVESYDTQYISKAVVEGVFRPKKSKSNVLQLAWENLEADGFCTETHPFPKMPAEAERWIDAIAMIGTPYDHVCLLKCVARNTFKGRLDMWNPTSTLGIMQNDFWRAHKYFEAFVGTGGNLDHHMGDVFEHDLSVTEDDTLWVDPPKVVTSTDIYFKMAPRVNGMLLQREVTQPRWGKTDVLPRLRRLIELPAKRVVFFYCSDVQPSDGEIQKLLESCGTITERIRVLHGSKADYAYQLDKE